MRTKDKPLDYASLLAVFVGFLIPFFWVFYIRLFGVDPVFVVGRLGVLTPLGLLITWSILGICLFIILYRAAKK